MSKKLQEEARRLADCGIVFPDAALAAMVDTLTGGRYRLEIKPGPQSESRPPWQPGSIKPPADGNSRLVVLCADNDLGFTTAHPVMAEYSFFKNREEWTIYLDGSHHEVTDQVRWWIDLPPIPAD